MKSDIAVYYNQLSQVWWRNSSNGTWEGGWIDAIWPYTLVEDVDFDGDGKADVAAYYPGPSQVGWRNSSDGTRSGAWIDSSSSYILLAGAE